MRDSAPSPDRPGHDDAAAGLLDRRRCLGRLAALALAGGAVPAHAARRRPGRDSAAASLPAPVDQLPAALRQALESSGLPLESFGLHAQPLDGGEALLSWQAARPFVLASTSKLLTSMAALDLLGPAYCWRTRAYLSGPLTQGRLLGDLVIRGGGDATLTSADLLQWFREIQAQGLREVWGDIVINREAFRLRPEDLATTPEPTPERPHHVRPDALALDAGVVRVALRSDAGGRTDIEVTPPLHDVRLVNSLGRGGGCAASAVLRDDGSQSSPSCRSAVSGRHAAARSRSASRRWACAIWVPVPSRACGCRRAACCAAGWSNMTAAPRRPGVSPRPVAVQRRLPSICRRRCRCSCAR